MERNNEKQRSQRNKLGRRKNFGRGGWSRGRGRYRGGRRGGGQRSRTNWNDYAGNLNALTKVGINEAAAATSGEPQKLRITVEEGTEVVVEAVDSEAVPTGMITP